VWQGTVEGLFIAPEAAAPMVELQRVLAVPGRGLEGDRYFAAAGTWSGTPGTGRHVTLIEAEAVEALAREHSIRIGPGDARRNIVTSGVPLNHLVGCDFVVGSVVLRGMRLCEPCGHLASLTKRGIVKGLVHRGGLRTEIVSGGEIRVGDEIRPIQSSAV
jgi:MOSC domain-containing protein YiiM